MGGSRIVRRMQRKELQPRLKRAYELIFAKLPKKTQRELLGE